MDNVAQAVSLAIEYAFSHVEADGHWYGEMRADATITSEYIFMRQALGLPLESNSIALQKALLSDQNEDGSWSNGLGLPGNISTTAEAYLALKILKMDPKSKPMSSARGFVRNAGGIAKVRTFTRIFFAMFGLFPWLAVPQMPPELILLPSWAAVNVYRLSSWSRATLVPLLVIVHRQPTFALPNGKSDSNDFLDELWCDPSCKNIPYGPSLWEIWKQNGLVSWGFAFAAADTALYYARGVLRRVPVREYAVRRCIEWILERQEDSGDWAGIFPPMINALLMLHIEGHGLESRKLERGLEAMERFVWKDKDGMRVQPCVSPVWDTILMMIGLCDAGVPIEDARLQTAIGWLEKRQLDDGKGDWKVYRPDLRTNGWAFEYSNSWYPDIDDTAAAVIAFVKQNPMSIKSAPVLNAIDWLLGMQNDDGGWAAFDVDNDKEYLNEIPFSDMGALCDPSTADVTGRVMEAFEIIRTVNRGDIDTALEKKMTMAVHQGFNFLYTIQEPNGSWWGRWGVNYLYGTSNVLCALAYSDHAQVYKLVKPAVQWLRECQHSDGGWGEGLDTYSDPSRAGKGDSTASQTAWALMGLLAHLPPTDRTVERGIGYLVATQVDLDGKGASWSEPQHTGTGFPGHFYLHYDFYRHYFPLMALGRYRKATAILQGKNSKKNDLDSWLREKRVC